MARGLRQRYGSGVERREMPNGLAWITRPERQEELAVLRCYVRGGSIAEWPNGGGGVAHWLEHLIATRAAQRAMRRELGVLLNASTHRDHTCFHWHVLADDGVESLDCFFASLRPDGAWRSELEPQRQVVLEEIRQRNASGLRQLRQRFLERLFPEHPVRYPVCGYESELEQRSEADVEEYLRRMYTPANLCVVAVGDLELDRLTGAIEAAADGMPGGRPWGIPAAPPPAGVAGRSFVIEADDSPQEYTEIGFQTAGVDSPDGLLFEVLASQVNCDREDPLRRSLTADGTAGEAVARSVSTAFGAGFFSILVEHRPGAGDRVGETVLGWLDKIAAGQSLPDLAWIENEPRLAIADHVLDDQAELLGMGELLQGDPLSCERHLERLRQVQPGQIAAAVGRYARRDLVLRGGLRQRSGLASTVEVRRSVQRPSSLTLPNGVRLLALPSASPVTACQVIGRGGVMAESEQHAGRCGLMARLLPNSLPAAGRRALEAYRQAGSSARFYAFCDRDFFGVSLVTLTDRLDAGLELLAAMVLEPSFEVDPLERLRSQILASLGDSTWERLALQRLRETLMAGHPYGRSETGTPATLSGLSPADVASCHRQLVVGDNLVVVLAGRGATGDRLARLGELFRAAPRGTPTLPPPLTSSLPAGAPEVVSEPSKGWLATGFSGIAWNLADWCALELVKTLLVGPRSTVATGRLVAGLRREGISYSLYCHHQPGFGEGYFGFVVGAEERHQKRVEELVEAEVEALRASPPSESELRVIRKHYLLDHVRLYEKPRSQGYFAACHAYLSGDTDDWARLPRHFQAVSAEQIREAANRLLVPATRRAVIAEPRRAMEVVD